MPAGMAELFMAIGAATIPISLPLELTTGLDVKLGLFSFCS